LPSKHTMIHGQGDTAPPLPISKFSLSEAASSLQANRMQVKTHGRYQYKERESKGKNARARTHTHTYMKFSVCLNAIYMQFIKKFT